MFGDHRLQRSFLAQTGGEFGAQHVQISLGFGFFEPLVLEEAPKLVELFGDSGNALRNRFEFEGELSALATEGLYLKVRVRDFSFETAGFAICSRESLFGLSQLIAKTRNR